MSMEILFALFSLSLAAVIAGWSAQKIHGQITVYVAGCLIIAVLYINKPKITALLYGLSGVTFMILLKSTRRPQLQNSVVFKWGMNYVPLHNFVEAL